MFWFDGKSIFNHNFIFVTVHRILRPRLGMDYLDLRLESRGVARSPLDSNLLQPMIPSRLLTLTSEPWDSQVAQN